MWKIFWIFLGESIDKIRRNVYNNEVTKKKYHFSPAG